MLDNTFFSALTIVGTNHVSPQSHDDITNAFISADPSVVAVELDQQRYNTLRDGGQRSPTMRLVPKIGFTGYVFAKITYHLQRYLGQKIGVMPGAEMLHAANLAQNHSRQLRLIDRPIEKTLTSLNETITFREKLRLLKDFLVSPFQSLPFDIDLTTAPDDEALQRITEYLERRYPGLHTALIQERDHHMAREIFALLKDEENVLAVVGAAHKNGIKQRLHELYQANPTRI